MEDEEEEHRKMPAVEKEPAVVDRAFDPSFVLGNGASAQGMDVSAELPFLVTNYLANYNHHGSNVQDVERIRKAASDLAKAFESLGAFGTATRPMLSSDRMLLLEADSSGEQPASFGDVKRQWRGAGAASTAATRPDQLENLVRAAVASQTLVEQQQQQQAPRNLVQASQEEILEQKRRPQSGRTLNDAIEVADNDQQRASNSNTGSAAAAAPQMACSSLWKPVLLRAAAGPDHADRRDASSSSVVVTLASALEERIKQAAATLRSYLDMRDKLRSDERQIRQLNHSIQFQQQVQTDLMQQRERLSFGEKEEDNGDAKVRALGEIQEGEQNCTRVLAQIKRQLEPLNHSQSAGLVEVVKLERAAKTDFASVQALLCDYRDPLFHPCQLEAGKPVRNHVLLSLAARERGLSILPLQREHVNVHAQVSSTRRAMLFSRLSHAATINTHLAYPIYCLRFDRTGRYFITGADDYLVRVFCFGNSNFRHQAQQPTLDYEAVRGAVLVCTLRGHAGVINDIDVSADNSFLATASEDGDCRVWGLKDGSPVAILRGHVGGANMVSWSTLTPYRLVTTGADGYARTWDVREACLKRYGKVIGKRPEYRLQLTTKEQHQSTALRSSYLPGEEASRSRTDQSLTPLPARRGTSDGDAVEISEQHSQQPDPPQPVIPLPPLPQNPQMPAVPLPVPPLPPAVPVDNAVPQEDEQIASGAFVANDMLDEGVKLLSKLKHNAINDKNSASPGARSRRSPVKVICLARCPHGGHFATGSDDGVCRVWKDEDDPAVQTVDCRHSPKTSGTLLQPNATSRSFDRNSSQRLLLELKGHKSAITDLQYSHAGDRLLTASQKDGMVKIFSWSAEPSNVTTNSRQLKTPTVFIQLTNPNAASGSSGTGQNARRRPKNVSSSSVSCDVAVWICDDTKIVTSQSELVKQSGTEINPGSQYIFLWDSYTGNCLLGIAEAHEKQCPAVIPHPFEPNILCSAGADGFVKLWDCTSGRVFFSFENLVEYGPHDPNEDDKSRGFLDGSFSPDGTGLVLTDDGGRVVVFDCAKPTSVEGRATPVWMREQYFSNDYYDLVYDSNGYCIERGSALPPHLAPTGVRCSHGGVPHPDVITAAFKNLVGPLPLSEYQARFHRRHIASLRQAALARHIDHGGTKSGRYDPKVTIMITGTGSASVLESRGFSSCEAGQALVTARRERAQGVHRLSSNWRWSGYDDMLLGEDAHEDEYMDADDEEYEQTEGRRSARANQGRGDSDSDDDDISESMIVEDSPAQRSRRRTPRSQDVDSDDSEGAYDEFVSNNTKPSGPYVVDYDTHFFRTKADLQRDWLLRSECNTANAGRKFYAPQLGDTVVYIPRAHEETLEKYPRLSRPWHKWPKDVEWPVVRCCIKHIRYRFPFKEYARQRQGQGKIQSIVALLTLEVTGVPERTVTWLAPVFAEPTERFIFELSLFQYASDDFLIPLGLYVQRLSRLELPAREKKEAYVEVFYKDNDEESVDPTLRAYRGRIVSFEGETVDDSTDKRIQGRGWGSIEVRWDENGEVDRMSPWEIDVIGAELDAPSRGRLTEVEKRTVLETLISLKEDATNGVFFVPVNDRRYSDYHNMVEVPMDLSFVERRVETDYYVSMLSVVSDVKLMRDNCAKYNGEDDELVAVANTILDKFAKGLLTVEEQQSLEEFEEYARSNVSCWSLQPARSVLENHSAPVSMRHNGLRGPDRSEPHARRTLQSVSTGSANNRRLRSTANIAASRNSVPRRSARNPVEETVPVRQRRVSHRRGVGQSDSLGQQQNQTGRHTRGRVSQPMGPGGRSSQSRRELSGSQPIQAERPSRPARAATQRLRNWSIGSEEEDVPSTQQQLTSSRARSAARESDDSAQQRATRRSRTARTNPSNQDEFGNAPRRSPNRTVPNRHPREVGTENSFSSSDEDDERRVPSRPGTRSSSRNTNHATQGDDQERIMTRNAAGSSGRRSEEDSGDKREAPLQPTTRCSTRLTSAASSNQRSTPPSPRRSRRLADEEFLEGSEHGYVEPDAPTTRSRSQPKRGPSNTRGDDSSASEFEENAEVEDSFGTSDVDSDADGGVVDSPVRGKRKARTTQAPRETGKSSTRSRLRASAARGTKARPEPDSPRRLGLRSPTRNPGLYQEHSESEFTDSDREDKEEDEEPSSSPPSKKRKSASRGSHQPKKRVKVSGKESQNGVMVPSAWPEINKKHITKVTKKILQRLGDLDQDGIFALPVEEAYPDLARDYKKMIKHPMDFRTILEDKLPTYMSIKELKQDLVQTFQNCMVFNESDSDYWNLAKIMLEDLDQVFSSVCLDCGVTLPSRW